MESLSPISNSEPFHSLSQAMRFFVCISWNSKEVKRGNVNFRHELTTQPYRTKSVAIYYAIDLQIYSQFPHFKIVALLGGLLL